MELGNKPIDTTQYKAPTSVSALKINQNLYFNLLWSCNSDASTPTLQLFKTFATALQDSDQFLSLLPVDIKKQSLPSLSNKTQIATTDNNKIQIYFKSYFSHQQYSLSGFFHTSSSLTLDELIAAPKVYEWLESNCYSIKPSPSNTDKMVQIRALCFSSVLIYREDGYSLPCHNLQSYILQRVTSKVQTKALRWSLFAVKSPNSYMQQTFSPIYMMEQKKNIPMG